MTTAGQYREQHCTYHLILFAASASCAAEIYRRSYPRKLYKYCRGDISVAPYANPRPLDIQMSAGISGLWQRFSASKYYLPPHRRAPLRRRRGDVHRRFARRKKYKASFSRRGSISPFADLFIPTRLNDSITDRARSHIRSCSLHRKYLLHSSPFPSSFPLPVCVVTHSRIAPFFNVSTFRNVCFLISLFKDGFFSCVCMIRTLYC